MADVTIVGQLAATPAAVLTKSDFAINSLIDTVRYLALYDDGPLQDFVVLVFVIDTLMKNLLSSPSGIMVSHEQDPLASARCSTMLVILRWQAPRLHEARLMIREVINKSYR